jgi:hypothetical protein
MLRKKSETSEEKHEGVKQESTRTIADDQIVTERKLPRRSFLTAAGTVLAGGALAIVSGTRATAQEPDSDAKPEKKDNDADKKKGTGGKTAKAKKEKKAKGGKDTDADKTKEKKETKDSDQ